MHLLGALVFVGVALFQQHPSALCLAAFLPRGSSACGDAFVCKNGECLSHLFVCDGENDCGDNSDEENCENHSILKGCKNDEFTCADGFCIDMKEKCDGIEDCIDGSDEKDCQKTMECSTFKCKNGQCIPNEWKCDGTFDCVDKSDEIDCHFAHTSETECKASNHKFLCANNKTCINVNKVCDKTNDCPDKSDESPAICAANAPNPCSALNCSHECVRSSAGHECICRPGYRLVNKKNCEDVNECNTYGICSQRCINTPGSYRCDCDPQYALQPDKKTCKIKSGDPILYFAVEEQIRSFCLKSKTIMPVVTDRQLIVGVGSDGHHIYWTDKYQNHEGIFKANPDGSDVELLVRSGIKDPEGIAVDWITGNVYFTDAEKKHIAVCTGSGKTCTVIVEEDLERPRGIVLNPAKGEMFWSDWGEKPRIMKANMDGTNQKVIISENISWPNGLALDLPNNRLYWVDAKKKRVESSKLDGSNRKVVHEEMIKSPFSISVFEDKIYWSDFKQNSLHSCDKFTGKNHTLLMQLKNYKIYGIYIQHEGVRTTTHNPCGMAFCSEMCLLSGSGYKCACNANERLNPDQHSCSPTGKEHTLVIGSGNVLLQIFHNSFGNYRTKSLMSPIGEIGALAYDDLNDALLVFDSSTSRLKKYDFLSKKWTDLVQRLDQEICEMVYDHNSNNLYTIDCKNGVVKALSLTTKKSTVIWHSSNLHQEQDVPKSLAIDNHDLVLYVALRSQVLRMNFDGSSIGVALVGGELVGPLKLAFDYDLHRLFVSDASRKIVYSISPGHDEEAEQFKHLMFTPSSMTFSDNDVFFTAENSKSIFWSFKYESGDDDIRNHEFELPFGKKMLAIAVGRPSQTPTPHPCSNLQNGGCSELCFPIGTNIAKCGCSIGLTITSDNRTCHKPLVCTSDQFHCEKSDVCVPHTFRCDGKSDCVFNEDEEHCPKKDSCAYGEFKCGDGTCISEEKVCDQHFDCADQSDEKGIGCKPEQKTQQCPKDYHRCSNGHCIPPGFMCDGVADCPDGSDEEICPEITCGPKQFQCKNGRCIPSHWECDHEYDCTDLSDEHENCSTLTCPPNFFTCNNGKCIDDNLKCNGFDECGDNSDEYRCEKLKTDCELPEIKCASEKSLNETICVNINAFCNGTVECPNGEDESRCQNCHSTDFECANGKCIPKEWLCDRKDDCGDNSDESQESCSNKNHTHANLHLHFAHIAVSCENGFRCKDGQCLNWKLVCDNVEDCPDGSDEHGSCNTSCNSNICSDICHPTPFGPKCACKTGYELKSDGKTCQDIDECLKQPPVCAQMCRNFAGSHACSCYDNYEIRADRTTCKALGKPMSLFFSTRHDLRKQNQHDKTLTRIAATPTSITSLDVVAEAGEIYYTTEFSSTIYRLFTNNGSLDHIEIGNGNPNFVTIDWATLNVYFYDSSTVDKSIKVCSFHTRTCVSIVKLDIHDSLTNLVVDVLNKRLFYSLTHFWVFNTPSSSIYSTKLDGSRKEELVKSFEGHVTGLDFDANKKLIYFNDEDRIFSAKYDVKNAPQENQKTVVISGLSARKPFGLNLFEDHLYFAVDGGFMGRCALFGEKRNCNYFRLDAVNVERFVIAQESRKIPLSNPCSGNKCNGVCIPVDVGTKCLCEDGDVAKDGEKCPEMRSAIGDDKRPRFKLHKDNMASDEATNSGSASSLIIGIFVAILLCSVALGAVYVYKKQRRRGQFTVSMKFVNPIYGRRPSSRNSSDIRPGEHEYCNPVSFSTTEMETTTNEILQKLKPLVKLDDQ